MRTRIILLAALLCAFLLVGCAQTPIETSEVTTETTTETAPDTSASTPPATEPAGIVIHDIRDWDALHLTGDRSEAYAFIGQFLGVSAPTFPELATVQISDYTIRYAENTLYFDFTVTASGLDTLPPGDYRTEVDWDFGVMLRVLEDDPTVTDEDFPCEDCRGLIGDFVMFEHRWNFPDYGTWGTREPENFIVWHYSDGLEMTLADYAATAERVLGIPADRERREGFAYINKDGVAVVSGGMSGFHAAYRFVGHSVTDGVHSTTVQYFADNSYLIKSHLVEYRIGADGELLGTTVLNRSAYEPWDMIEEWTD